MVDMQGKMGEQFGIFSLDVKNEQIVYVLQNNDIYEVTNSNPVKGPFSVPHSHSHQSKIISMAVC